MPFEDLLTDRVTFMKKDGTVMRRDVRASVQRRKIFIIDADLPVEPGDHFLRQLPSGLIEDFIVDDPGFVQGALGIESHFQATVRRSDVPMGSAQTVTNHISGHNARVNIGSTDNSINVFKSQSALFTGLEKASTQIADTEKREAISEAIRGMREAHENQSGDFLEKYRSFISLAADHMTFFAPFLPDLASLLG